MIKNISQTKEKVQLVRCVFPQLLLEISLFLTASDSTEPSPNPKYGIIDIIKANRTSRSKVTTMTALLTASRYVLN